MHFLRLTDLKSVLFSTPPLVLLLGLTAAVLLPGAAQAQVNAVVAPVLTPGVLNTYQYTITNVGPDSVGEFDLAVPMASTLTSIMAPFGWLSLYTPGDTFISWESTDPSTDVARGSSLGGFGFQSSLSAGLDSFQLTDYNTGDTENGMVLGPVAVPEASTTISFGLLLALGLGAMAAAKRKSVRQAS